MILNKQPCQMAAPGVARRTSDACTCVLPGSARLARLRRKPHVTPGLSFRRTPDTGDDLWVRTERLAARTGVDATSPSGSKEVPEGLMPSARHLSSRCSQPARAAPAWPRPSIRPARGPAPVAGRSAYPVSAGRRRSTQEHEQPPWASPTPGELGRIPIRRHATPIWQTGRVSLFA